MKSTRSRLSFALAAAVFAAVCLPVIFSTLYAMPYADDFSLSNSVRDYAAQNGEGALRFAFALAARQYQNWNGCFASYFLDGLLPFYRIGVGGLRAVLFCNALLFYTALLLMTRSIFVNVLRSDNKPRMMWTAACLAALVTEFSTLADVFLWLVGAFGYTVVISAFMLSAALAPVALSGGSKNKRVAAYCACCVLLVVSCGGTLVITSAVCFTYLCVFLYFALKRSRLALASGGLFAAAFAAALVNALAPGNFARREVLAPDAGFSVLSAVKDAAKLCISNVKSYITQSPVLAVLLLASVFIIYPVLRERAAGFSKRALLALLPASPMLYYAAVFPYMLAAPGQNPPARVYYVYFFFFSLAAVFAAFCVCGILASLRRGAELKLPVKGAAVAAALALALLTFRATPPAAYRSPAYAGALLSGELRDFAAQYSSLLEQIERSPDSDVVIESDLEQSVLMPSVDLRPNAEYWTNQELAYYCGKNSVSVIY